MPQFGLFDYQKQLALLEKAGDPLIEIKAEIKGVRVKLNIVLTAYWL